MASFLRLALERGLKPTGGWFPRVTRSLSTAPVRGADNRKTQVDEGPIKYTTSEAHTKWKSAFNSRDPDFERTTPPSQRMVVIVSLSVFLIYFTMLREESDIDEGLFRPLFETVPHLERPMIEASIAENRRIGRDTQELEVRLAELVHKEKLLDIVEAKQLKSKT